MKTYVITDKEFKYFTEFSEVNAWSNNIFYICSTAFVTLGHEAIFNTPNTIITSGIVYLGLVVSIVGGIISYIYRKKVKKRSLVKSTYLF